MAPSPRENALLFGHEWAEAAWTAAWTKGRLPHAWLITGPPGVGKCTLAWRILRRYLSGDPADTAVLQPAHPLFRQLAQGAHPDLHVLAPRARGRRTGERTEQSVQDVRDLLDQLHRTGALGRQRALLVDEVESAMNRQGVNALLKLLEEPPPGLLFLVVTQRPGLVPPTILSRCIRLRLRSTPTAVVAEALSVLAPDSSPEERAAAAAVARGSIGRAISVLETDWIGAYGALLDGLERAPGSISARLAAADLLAARAQEEGVGAATDLIVQMLRRTARADSIVTPIVPDEPRRLASLSRSLGLDRHLALWDKLHDLTASVESVNLDPSHAYLSVVQGIVDASRAARAVR